MIRTLQELGLQALKQQMARLSWEVCKIAHVANTLRTQSNLCNSTQVVDLRRVGTRKEKETLTQTRLAGQEVRFCMGRLEERA